MPSIADLTRDQFNLVLKLCQRMGAHEYQMMRVLGYSAIESADHALAMIQDIKGIVESDRTAS